jgi:hypothetical protein
MNDVELRELGYLARRDAGWRLGRCVGKQRFGSRLYALRAISYNLKSDRVHPYRCPFCGQYHVGSTIAPRAQSRRGGKNASHGGHT